MPKKRIDIWNHPINWVGFRHKDRMRIWPFKYRDIKKVDETAGGRRLTNAEQTSLSFFNKLIGEFPEETGSRLRKMFNQALIEKGQHEGEILHLTGDLKTDRVIHEETQKIRLLTGEIDKKKAKIKDFLRKKEYLKKEQTIISGNSLRGNLLDVSNLEAQISVLEAEILEHEGKVAQHKEEVIIALTSYL
ncbi:MAG: hypothetical protein V1672_01305 [Candidatus Diapherotrites archaeon]